MKCCQDCNSNSCCVRQLDGRLNHSVKSHFPQCCACFLYLLPFHQNYNINSTERCFAVVHSWLCRAMGEVSFSKLSAQHRCAAEFALPGTCFPKSQIRKEQELRLKPMCMVLFPCMQDTGRHVLFRALPSTFQLQSRAFWSLVF